MRVVQIVLSLTQILKLLHTYTFCIGLTYIKIQKEIRISFSSFRSV